MSTTTASSRAPAPSSRPSTPGGEFKSRHHDPAANRISPIETRRSIVSNTSFLRTKGGIMDSAAIVGCKVENSLGENLGKIEGIMLDLTESRILYVVLSFG